MDSLTHLVLALAGGYVLVLGRGVRLRPHVVPAAALASLLIDVDHIPPHFGVAHTLVLHNLAFVLVVAALTRLLPGLEIGLLACVMLVGHLLMDMVYGLYGIPLFYPLSAAGVMIPKAWEIWLFGDESYAVVSRTGIGLAIYAAFTSAFILAPGRRGKRLSAHTASWRRTRTRTPASKSRR